MEVFAGKGWCSTFMKVSGIPTASFDISYQPEPPSGKHNNMDIRSPAGFALLSCGTHEPGLKLACGVDHDKYGILHPLAQAHPRYRLEHEGGQRDDACWACLQFLRYHIPGISHASPMGPTGLVRTGVCEGWQ